MQSTYPKQNCGCDFCCSRRSVNAKKLAASQAAFQRSGIMQRNGCNCCCHSGGPEAVSSFDPEYPVPVNQTALNASRGRNGVPEGNQYTIRNNSTRAGGPGASQTVDRNGLVKETAEQREAREAAELDALERLLMLEYKARTQATMEANRLKRNATSANNPGPKPLPEGYTSGSIDDRMGYSPYGTEARGGTAAGEGSFGSGACTIHEAYAMAHNCPAEPPAQCHASHRLQDTMDDVRKVTADPVHTGNRLALQKLLHQHGMAESPASDNVAAADKITSGTELNAFGTSLAQIRTSYAHPRGAGVVWVPTQVSAAASLSAMKDSDALVVDHSAAAGSGNSKCPPGLSPGAAAALATAMIRDQCHAYCRCSYCAQEPQKSCNAGASMWATMEALDRPGMSKDELYMKSLHQSLRAKAFLDSSKNAGKFIPDEQLLSSIKRRDAKELALTAELVPVRRRDRLQELVLLENKHRLREEAALRAERRALGLPEEEEEEEEPVSTVHSDSPASTRPSSKESMQQRLSSGAATPASRCSAEHDLHTMLKGIKNIVDEDPAPSSHPLTREQVYKLRQLMHTQKKKTREMVDNCENQPHVCGHCLDVDVQARHLSAVPNCSVAYGLTGKVINPEEGIKFGTHTQREPNEMFNTSTVDAADISGRRSRLTSYNAHPYGTGVVFLPVSSLNGKSQNAVGSQSTRFRASFNNNIGRGEPVEEELQFPGSTYNVYDSGFAKATTPQPETKGDKAERTIKIDTASSNESSQHGVNEPKVAAIAAPEQPTYNSSAAMWMTTNQDRELDMKRFLEFQKKLKTNSKRVYEETASRSAKALSA